MPQLSPAAYIMEDPRQAPRLERRVDARAWVKKNLEQYLFPGAEVLSAGCGPGTTLGAISDSHPILSATGIDLSPLRIRQAIKQNRRNPHLRFCCGDARQMQFASHSFDVVYARMLLRHFTEKQEAVNEMVRVCRPGGVVLLQDVDGEMMWHYPEDPDVQHTLSRVMASLADTGFDPFTGRKLSSLARMAGLKNTHVQVECHHLIAGNIDPEILKQWELKLEIAKPSLEQTLGSKQEAVAEIRRLLDYLSRPDTLSYSNVFTVTGEKPL